ncbi:hypothetical protein ACPMJQ_27755 [Streptomyces pseudogriseolus]|uniref:hypothetical protein n=1 Tax=Streptomyces pseudogriseolus TaxID=36817 RepID=UPI003FA24FF8
MLLVVFASVIVGLIVAMAFVATDKSMITAVSAGGGSLAFTFSAGMTILSYIRKQDG